MFDSDTLDTLQTEEGDSEGAQTVEGDSEGVDLGSHLDDDLELSRRERAVLEFFIAKIRLRSQRAMKYWAMVPTLCTHSRGYMKSLPNHPLHGVGCCMSTLWSTLNDMYESATPARMDVIENQYTMSVAFDNWQQMIQKIWQTSGCSSNYLKGVASFAKKDKAVLLPLKSILKSPSGLRFRVLHTEFIDAYSTIVRGKLIACGGVPENTTSLVNDERESDEVVITTGALVWPMIGWEVEYIAGVPCHSPTLSYVHTIIPHPP